MPTTILQFPMARSVFALALLIGSCRGRATPVRVGTPALDGATRGPEAAALLLVDQDGGVRIACLPGRGQPRGLFSGTKLLQVQDAIWKAGRLTVAALTGPSEGTFSYPGGQLVLLLPGVAPRTLARGARLARFSPDGEALLFQSATREHAGGGAVVEVASSHVLDLASGEIEDLGDVVDPRWEADSKHVRATRLSKRLEDRGASVTVRWTSLRMRWDRQSKTAVAVGPGCAQIPAPRGAAVAWSEDQRGLLLPSHCAVWIGNPSGHQHPTVGPFCMGIADDRGMRWSPDGRWLAFARPGPNRGEHGQASFFVDVVGIAGGRDPGMAAILTQGNPGQTDIVAREGAPWMDWSPSNRQLAVQDGADEVRVYDLEGHTVSFLGKGERPTWSPGGGYLHLLASWPKAAGEAASANHRGDGSAMEAFVLPGGSRTALIALGVVRDTRWLPAEACVEQ